MAPVIKSFKQALQTMGPIHLFYREALGAMLFAECVKATGARFDSGAFVLHHMRGSLLR